MKTITSLVRRVNKVCAYLGVYTKKKKIVPKNTRYLYKKFLFSKFKYFWDKHLNFFEIFKTLLNLYLLQVYFTFYIPTKLII